MRSGNETTGPGINEHYDISEYDDDDSKSEPELESRPDCL